MVFDTQLLSTDDAMNDLVARILLVLFGSSVFALFLKWAIPALIERIVREEFDERLARIDDLDGRASALEIARDAHTTEIRELKLKCEDIPATREILEAVREDLREFKIDMKGFNRRMDGVSTSLARVEGRLEERGTGHD